MPLTSSLIDKFEAYLDKKPSINTSPDTAFPIAVYLFPKPGERKELAELVLLESEKDLKVNMKIRILAVRCTKEKLQELIKLDEDVKAEFYRNANKVISSTVYEDKKPTFNSEGTKHD